VRRVEISEGKTAGSAHGNMMTRSFKDFTPLSSRLRRTGHIRSNFDKETCRWGARGERSPSYPSGPFVRCRGLRKKGTRTAEISPKEKRIGKVAGDSTARGTQKKIGGCKKLVDYLVKT